jgi:hypothetical protein
MLAGEAGNFASDRPDFLGSHPDASSHLRPLKPS